jgi:hypothetical protein
MTFRLRSTFITLTVLVASLPAVSQAVPKIYIEAEPQFATALAAAIEKKHVDVIVVVDPKAADFTLKSAPVNSKDESGAGKVARCLFLDCIGINGNSAVSVELVRSSDSAVVWAYQVRKANSGPLGIQSLSEAIAKHLKNDYLLKEKF